MNTSYPTNKPVSAVAWRTRVLTALLLAACSLAARADDPVSPDKSEYSLFDPTPDDQLRSFSTDRPPKANSPYTLDAGHFQYETDLAVFGYGTTSGTTTRDWTVLDPTLKVGLTNSIDAELQITPYESLKSNSASGGVNISGVGDTFARVKINVLGNDQGPVSIALLPYIKLPTARLGIGNGKVEGGIILPIGFSAPAGFTVLVMPEGDVLKNETGSGYHTALDFLINVSHPINKRWSTYTELFTTQFYGSQDSPIYTLDQAFTFALTPNLQIDFGGNFGLNSISPRNQVYAGISQRF